MRRQWLAAAVGLLLLWGAVSGASSRSKLEVVRECRSMGESFLAPDILPCLSAVRFGLFTFRFGFFSFRFRGCRDGECKGIAARVLGILQLFNFSMVDSCAFIFLFCLSKRRRSETISRCSTFVERVKLRDVDDTFRMFEIPLPRFFDTERTDDVFVTRFIF